MKYKLIIFDIDGTITRHVSSWQFLHEKLGIWGDLACRYQERFLAGKISYRRFCELDAAHWKGIPDRTLRKIFRETPYTKNAKKCLAKLKTRGYKLAAVSTGLQYMADRIKKELNFDYVISNRLNTRKGALTGGVRINIAHGAKGKTLRKITKKFNIKPQEMISVGDSATDIALAKFSGYSIAFNSSDRTLSRIADYNCATIDFKEVYDKIISVSNLAR